MMKTQANLSTSTEHVVISTKVYFDAVKKDIALGRSVIIPLKGVSMRPFIENMRDKALIVAVPKEKLQVGDAILAEIAPDKYVLHRIIRRQGDNLTLMGDGNIQGTESCKTSDVVGRVEAFYRKRRQKPDLTSGLKWRLYSALWTRLRPLRRYLLFAYRILCLHH